MKLTHIYTGSDNQSHFEEMEIPATQAALSGRMSTGDMPNLGIGIAESQSLPAPRGFHTAGRRQFVAVLKGGIEMEMGDGSKTTVLPGEIFFAGDMTGQGHKTRDLEVPTRVMYVLVPDDFDIATWKS